MGAQPPFEVRFINFIDLGFVKTVKFVKRLRNNILMEERTSETWIVDKVFMENCLEGMKNIPSESIDCIICDLPYGQLNKSNPLAYWDTPIPLHGLWEQYLRVTKPNAPIILFGSGMFTAKLMMSQPKLWRYNLIWYKDRPTGFLNANRMPLRAHEDILVFYRKKPIYHPQMKNGTPNHSRGHKRGKNMGGCYGKYGERSTVVADSKYPTSVLKFSKDWHQGQHPTQKPVDLIRYLIRTFTNEGDVVLDNCIGSGTCAVACIKEHRHFIGYEMDEKYFNMAKLRISQALHEWP